VERWEESEHEPQSELNRARATELLERRDTATHERAGAVSVGVRLVWDAELRAVRQIALGRAEVWRVQQVERVNA
jgi:hypothetical protein